MLRTQWRSLRLKMYTVGRFHCRLNWKDAKASALVAAGDMISCAGKGRVEVAEIDVTKKDRYAVQLVRYV